MGDLRCEWNDQRNLADPGARFRVRRPDAVLAHDGYSVFRFTTYSSRDGSDIAAGQSAAKPAHSKTEGGPFVSQTDFLFEAGRHADRCLNLMTFFVEVLLLITGRRGKVTVRRGKFPNQENSYQAGSFSCPVVRAPGHA
jgi:hypothetical protein